MHHAIHVGLYNIHGRPIAAFIRDCADTMSYRFSLSDHHASAPPQMFREVVYTVCVAK